MDRIVIQHVIPLEIAWIIHEIVVNRIVADLDRRITDYSIQINRLQVPGTGVFFCHHLYYRYSNATPRKGCDLVV